MDGFNRMLPGGVPSAVYFADCCRNIVILPFLRGCSCSVRIDPRIVQALVFVRLRPPDLVMGPSPLITRPPVLLMLLLLLSSVSVLRLTLLLVLPLRLSKKTLNLLLLLPLLLRWRWWLGAEIDRPDLPESASVAVAPPPPPANGHHRRRPPPS